MDDVGPSFGIFPLEIVEYLLYFFDGHVLSRALQTCKTWYSLGNNEKIWRTAWNNYFNSHTPQFQNFVLKVLVYHLFMHSNRQKLKDNKFSLDVLQVDPSLSFRKLFLLASNIVYVAKNPKTTIFHNPAQFFHEPSRLFTTIEEGILHCVTNGYLVILGLTVSSSDEFFDSSLVITKPIHILCFAKLINPSIVWRIPPNTRGTISGLQATCKNPIRIESGTLSLTDSTVKGIIRVASQAELLSVNSQLEYLDEQKFGNDTTALLEVEGQASLSDCNVLTSGPYAIEVTSTGDVTLSNCTLSGKSECIKLTEGSCLDMKTTFQLQTPLINEQGIAILAKYIDFDTNPKRVAGACRSLGTIGSYGSRDILFCRAHLPRLLKCLLTHMDQPLVINGAVYGIEMLCDRCIKIQQDGIIELDEFQPPLHEPLDYLIEPLLNVTPRSMSDPSTILSIFNTLRALVSFYGRPYLQKMMDLDCWTLVATALKENTQDTPIHQRVVISVARFIEASHQLFKKDHHQTKKEAKADLTTKINIVNKLVKEGAIEALVKCLARIVENVHTLEEYFDTVYPITVSLENLHITPEFLACLGKNHVVSLCLKLIRSPIFDLNNSEDFHLELSEAITQLFKLLQRTMKEDYYEFIDCGGVKTIMNYIKDSVNRLPLASFYAFEVLRNFVDLGTERDRKPFIAVISEGIVDFMLELLNTHPGLSFLATCVSSIVEILAKEKEASEILSKGLFNKLLQCLLSQGDDQFLPAYLAGVFRSLLLNENLNQNEIDQKFIQLDIYSLIVRLMSSHVDDASYFYEISLILHWLGFRGRLERYIGPHELTYIFQSVFVQTIASPYVIGKLFTVLPRIEKFRPLILEQLRLVAEEITQHSNERQSNFKKRLAIYHVIHNLSYVTEGGNRQFFVEGGILKILETTLKCEEPTKNKFPAYVVIDTLGHFGEDDEIRKRYGDVLKTLCALTVEYAKVTEMTPSQRNLFDAWLPWSTNRICGIMPSPPPQGQVILLAATNNVKISADGLRCLNSCIFFESVRTNYGVKKGKIYVEVELLTSGLFQIGWLTPQCQFRPFENDGYGVGDDFHSWAVDFYRGIVWHKKPSPYGEAKLWKEGDIIQMYLDLDQGEISWGLNGTHFGVAFRDIPLGEIFFAGASLSTDQECRWNFGNQSFRYAIPEGYKPYCACIDITDNTFQSHFQ